MPAIPTIEIRDADGLSVSIGDLLDGDFRILCGGEEVGRILSRNARQVDGLNPLILSEPPEYTFTVTIYRPGNSSGNARDRRKARRAGRSLENMLRRGDD